MPKHPTRPSQPPHPGDLIKVIHEHVVQGRVSYTRHALDVRMPERGFDVIDVEHILVHGMVDGSITAGRSPGEWECTVRGTLPVGHPQRSREGGVVVAVRKAKLIIITVQWMDP